MSTQLYTLAEIYADGAKLTEETGVKISWDPKNQVIETVARSFAGVSPGASMMTVTVDNAVPAAGVEYDVFKKMKDLTVVELTIFAAGKTLTSKGFIMNSSFSHSVNSASTLAFDFAGEFAVFE